MKSRIHRKPEENQALNTEATNAGIQEVNATLKSIDQSLKNPVAQFTGLQGMNEKQNMTNQKLEQVTQSLSVVPTPIVSKLEEVKSAALATNIGLKRVENAILSQEKTEIPEFPKEMEVSLKGISVVTIKGDQGEPGKDGKDADEERVIAEAVKRIPKPKDGKDGRDGKDGKNIDENRLQRSILSKIPTPKDGKNGENGKDGSPDTPDEVVEKVNSAKKKIKVKQIEGLSSFIKEIGERDTMNQVGIMSGTGDVSLLFFAQDISSQCNGSNKTFVIPQNRLVLYLSGTQFPGVYRPLIDFTISGVSRETLTLTNEVSAPESGQTLIVAGIRP